MTIERSASVLIKIDVAAETRRVDKLEKALKGVEALQKRINAGGPSLAPTPREVDDIGRAAARATGPMSALIGWMEKLEEKARAISRIDVGRHGNNNANSNAPPMAYPIATNTNPTGAAAAQHANSSTAMRGVADFVANALRSFFGGARHFDRGGGVTGFVPGAPGIGEYEDKVPVFLTKNEFVVPVKPAKKYAVILEAMRRGEDVPALVRRHFDKGGMVSAMPATDFKMVPKADLQHDAMMNKLAAGAKQMREDDATKVGGKQHTNIIGLVDSLTGQIGSRQTRNGLQDLMRELMSPARIAARKIATTSGPDHYESGGLIGAPTSAMIPGVGRVPIEPSQHIRQVAAAYMKAMGLRYKSPTSYTKTDPRVGSLIADEYSKMANAPHDPKVASAYGAMSSEVIAQYDFARRAGLRASFITPGMADPYAKSPRLAIEDIQKNKHMWVFPTSSGFGSDAGFDASSNPLLADSGMKIGGHPAMVNDLFRVVHDYFGHAKEGFGMRAEGEENAWAAHMAMFSPNARRAMTSETRGQNSWVNYGPHGATNRKASGSDTIYADQKVGIMPDWTMLSGLKLSGMIPHMDHGGKLDRRLVRKIRNNFASMISSADPEARKFGGFYEDFDSILREKFSDDKALGVAKRIYAGQSFMASDSKVLRSFVGIINQMEGGGGLGHEEYMQHLLPLGLTKQRGGDLADALAGLGINAKRTKRRNYYDNLLLRPGEPVIDSKLALAGMGGAGGYGSARVRKSNIGEFQQALIEASAKFRDDPDVQGRHDKAHAILWAASSQKGGSMLPSMDSIREAIGEIGSTNRVQKMLGGLSTNYQHSTLQHLEGGSGGVQKIFGSGKHLLLHTTYDALAGKYGGGPDFPKVTPGVSAAFLGLPLLTQVEKLVLGTHEQGGKAFFSPLMTVSNDLRMIQAISGNRKVYESLPLSIQRSINRASRSQHNKHPLDIGIKSRANLVGDAMSEMTVAKRRSLIHPLLDERVLGHAQANKGSGASAFNIAEILAQGGSIRHPDVMHDIYPFASRGKFLHDLAKPVQLTDALGAAGLTKDQLADSKYMSQITFGLKQSQWPMAIRFNAGDKVANMFGLEEGKHFAAGGVVGNQSILGRVAGLGDAALGKLPPSLAAAIKFGVKGAYLPYFLGAKLNHATAMEAGGTKAHADEIARRATAANLLAVKGAMAASASIAPFLDPSVAGAVAGVAALTPFGSLAYSAMHPVATGKALWKGAIKPGAAGLAKFFKGQQLANGGWAGSGHYAHGTSYLFYSPNVGDSMDPKTAAKKTRSSEQASLKAESSQLLSALGLKHETHSSIGDWATGAENSISQKVVGEQDAARYAVAKLGLSKRQLAALLFNAGQGNDALYHLDTKEKDLNALRKTLGENGVDFRTIIPTKTGHSAVVFDQGRQMRERMDAVAAHYQSEVKETLGTGEFVGGTQDSENYLGKDTRTAAARRYKKIIKGFEAITPLDLSKGMPKHMAGGGPVEDWGHGLYDAHSELTTEANKKTFQSIIGSVFGGNHAMFQSGTKAELRTGGRYVDLLLNGAERDNINVGFGFGRSLAANEKSTKADSHFTTGASLQPGSISLVKKLTELAIQARDNDLKISYETLGRRAGLYSKVLTKIGMKKIKGGEDFGVWARDPNFVKHFAAGGFVGADGVAGQIPIFTTAGEKIIGKRGIRTVPEVQGIKGDWVPMSAQPGDRVVPVRNARHFASGGDVIQGVAMSAIAGGPVGAAVGIGLTAFEFGLRGATVSLNTWNDSLLTSAQKVQKTEEEWIPFMKQIRELGDAIDNTTNRIAKSNQQMAIDMNKLHAVSTMNLKEDSLKIQQAQYLGTAHGMESRPLAYGPTAFANTALGDLQARESSMRVAAQNASIHAQRSTAGAEETLRLGRATLATRRSEAEIATRHSDRMSRRSAQVEQRENASHRQGTRRFLWENIALGTLIPGGGLARHLMGGPARDQAGRTEAGNSAITAITEASNARVRQMQQEQEVQRAGLEVERQRTEQAKAAVEAGKTELAIMQERSQRMRDDVMRLGGMGRGSRRQAERALQIVRRRGVNNIDRLPEELVARAARFAPREIQNMQRERGQQLTQDAARRGMLDEIGMRDWAGGAALGDTLNREKELANAIQQQLDAAATGGARNIASEFTRTMNDVAKILKEEFALTVALFREEIRKINNSR